MAKLTMSTMAPGVPSSPGAEYAGFEVPCRYDLLSDAIIQLREYYNTSADRAPTLQMVERARDALDKLVTIERQVDELFHRKKNKKITQHRTDILSAFDKYHQTRKAMNADLDFIKDEFSRLRPHLNIVQAVAKMIADQAENIRTLAKISFQLDATSESVRKFLHIHLVADSEAIREELKAEKALEEAEKEAAEKEAKGELDGRRIPRVPGEAGEVETDAKSERTRPRPGNAKKHRDVAAGGTQSGEPV
jgi:hypothetical protein